MRARVHVRMRGQRASARKREPWSAGRVGLVVMLVGLVVIFGGDVHQNHGLHWSALIDGLYANVGSELSGMAIVILLIDRFAARREDERLRGQLLRELGSTDPGLTARSVLELEARGWLFDGTLSAAQLSGAKLAGARLERAAMRGVMLAGADLTRANLSGAGLAGANFADAVLESANLEMADLGGALLPHACLRRADAALARFGGANLAGADLGEADLTEADLSRADLRGADLSGARLDGVRLSGAMWDEMTRWPEGFVPLAPMVPVAPPVDGG